MNLIRNLGKVLIIAPHADDETLGCGGLISRLMSNEADCHIHVVTGLGENEHPLFSEEIFTQIRKEFKKAIYHLGSPQYSFGNLPSVILNDMPIYQINESIKEVIEKNNPNTIFIPFENDLHNDHKIINYASKVASRPYLEMNKDLYGLIEYEVPSETNIYMKGNAEAFCPNLFLEINSEFDNKLKAFSEYKSQLQSENQPRSLQGLKSHASYRGINIGVKFAEAFRIIFNKL